KLINFVIGSFACHKSTALNSGIHRSRTDLNPLTPETGCRLLNATYESMNQATSGYATLSSMFLI
ncbi:hypothetical protein L9F63_003733, partial [Diploptera punctata]